MTIATAPRITVRVPSEDDFGGADFLPDAALDALFDDVVSSYRRLGHIEDHGIQVSVLWKRKGGKSKGSATYGKCQKPSGLLAHFCTADFVIWLGADTIAEQEWTTEQIRKLLYHEARHIGWEDPDDDDAETAQARGRSYQKPLPPPTRPSYRIEQLPQAPEKSINEIQAQGLVDKLSECDEEYQKSVVEQLKKMVIPSVYELPESLYERVVSAAMKKQHENKMAPEEALKEALG